MLDSNPNEPLRHPFGPRDLAAIADSLAALPCDHVEDPLPLLSPEFIQIGSGGTTFICSTTRPCGPIPCGSAFTVFIGQEGASLLLHRLPQHFEKEMTERQIDALADFFETDIEWRAICKAPPESAEEGIEYMSIVLQDLIDDLIEMAG